MTIIQNTEENVQEYKEKDIQKSIKLEWNLEMLLEEVML